MGCACDFGKRELKKAKRNAAKKDDFETITGGLF